MSAGSEVPRVAEEQLAPGEDAVLARIVKVICAKYEHDYADLRPALRDQHAKPHACVRAEFAVSPDVPSDLRHGIFAEPRTYTAWVRFSSSSAQPRPDSKRDAHGMAIKLMGVEGDKVLPSERQATTQDFIVANNPVFFCRNPSDYVVLAARLAEGKLLRFFFPGVNPRRWHLRELVNMLVATTKQVTDPLQIRYWSQTPFALGPHAVKYSAKPHGAPADQEPVPAGRDQLEDAMVRRLATGDATFDFMVQLQTDPRRMPVEDPTIRWSERRSPFRRVATIRIPSQQFASQAQRNFAQNLSFSPSHALPEHRPLGGINRVRQAAYEVISELRHDKNDSLRREADGRDGP